MTGPEALAKMQAAVEYGQYLAALAPWGHPIHAATSDARERWEDLQDSLALWPPGVAIGSNIRAIVDRTTAAVYDAGATVRREGDPDAPLPPLVYRPWVPDWRWAVGGAAGLVALWWWFRD